MSHDAYALRRAARSEFLAVRGVNYHLRIWGEPQAGQVPLVLLHGWMDIAASFQFIVDQLAAERYIIAPDWRGFGLSACEQDNFYFPDYLADLDAILAHYVPSGAIDLVGHSMGAHAALLYAAARPDKIRKLVNLEGFGAPAAQADEAPGRYTRWLNELQGLRSGTLNLTSYADAAAVAARLMKTNPRLLPSHADWLAQHWAQPDSAGRWHILGAVGHKVISPLLFRVEEVQACYAAIKAPTLTLLAQDNQLHNWVGGAYTLAEYRQRLTHIANNRSVDIADAGHMLHHDQPAQVAALIEAFLDQP